MEMSILYIEDNPAHAELIQRTLETGNPKFSVQTASNIREAFSILVQTEFDVILCDHHLPDGSGLDVIEKARKLGITTAIVLITGQEDVNTAVAALKAGAVDYLVKQGDYLQKLPMALKNAYTYTLLEKQKTALQESEERYRLLVDLSPDAIIVHANGRIIFANPATAKLIGAEKPEDVLGKPVLSFVHPDSREAVTKRIQTMLATGGNVPIMQEKFIRLDGQSIDVEVVARPITYLGENGIQVVIRDITDRTKTQEMLERQLKELTILHAVAIAGTESTSEDEIIRRTTQITAVIYSDACGILLLDPQGGILTPHDSYIGADVERWKEGYPISEGVTGRAVREGRAIRIGDVTQDPAYLQIATGIKSELCVPIRVHNRIIGVINVESRRADAFDEKDERLLNTIAGGLGAALERFRLAKAGQERMKREAALFDLIRTAASSLDLNLVLQSILDQLLKIIPSDSGTIQLLNRNRLEVVAALGPEGKHFAERGPIDPEKFPLNLRVISEGEPLRIDDVRLDSRYVPLPESARIRSFLAIPLKSKDKIIGMLTLDSYKVGRYTDQDVELALTIARHAGAAIDNARLFEAEQRRRMEAEALQDATLTLTKTIEAEQLFQTILDALEKLVPFDSASIELINQDQFEIVAGRGINPSLIGHKYTVKPGKWEGEDRLLRVVIIDDVRQDDRFEKLEGSEYIRSWMGIPLFSQEKPIGYINLDSRTAGFFTAEHAALVQTFANQAATAIENARLFQEEKRRSEIIEAMASIANEISTEHEILPALDKITKRTLELLNASTVAVYLLQDDNTTLKIVAAQGAHRQQLLSHTLRLGSGITGNIVKTGKAEIVNDTFKDARRVRIPGTPEEDSFLDTMMSAPLILRGKAIGAINAWRRRADGLFNESELNFLVSIAHQTSISIESVRLFQETVRRAQEADAIAEVGRDISSTLKLDLVLERIAQYARELLDAETSAVYMVDPTEPALRAIAAIGLDADEIKNDPLQIGRGILGNIALQKMGEIVNDTVNDPRSVLIKGTTNNPLEHIMSAPVISKDELTGLLVVWRSGEEKEFKPHELGFLTSLAQQAAVAIENARLFEAEQRRRREAEILSEATAALANSLELGELMDTILDWLQMMAPYDSASIILQDNEKLVIKAGRGLPKELYNLKFDKTGTWTRMKDSRRPLIMPDAQASDLFEKHPGSEYIRGWMGVPMLAQNSLIGFINLDSRTPNAYTEEQAALVQTFANQAAIAIKNAFLFESEQKRIHELSAFYETAQNFQKLNTPEALANEALRVLKNAINMQHGSVLLLDEGKGILVPAAVNNEGNSPSEETGRQAFLPRFGLGEGIVGYVAQTGGKIRLSDARRDARYAPLHRDTISEMCVPMLAGDRIIGVINVEAEIQNAYSENDEHILETIAGNLATAVEKLRLFTEEKKRREEAENLRQAAAAITSSLEPQEVLETILIALKQVVPYDSASVFLLEGDKVRITAAKGLPHPEAAIGRLFPADNELFTAIQQANQPYFIGDAQADSRFEKWAGSDEIRGWMGVPLIARGKIIGYITLDSHTPNAFDTNSAFLAQTFAHQASAAIENARLFAETRRRLDEQQVISRISFSLRVAKNAKEMLPLLLKEVSKAVGTQSAAIWLYDRDRNELAQTEAAGWLSTIQKQSIRPDEGVIGRVFTTGKLYVSGSFAEEPLADPADKDQAWGGIILPIRTTAETIGTLVVSFPAGQPIEQHHIQLLSIIAEMAGNAIQRSSLFEQSEKQVQRLTALREIDTAIASSFDLRVTLNILTAHIMAQINAGAVDILTYDNDRRTLECITSTGFHTNAILQTSIRIGEDMTSAALLERKDVYIEDVGKEAGFQRRQLFLNEGFASYCAVPLVSKGIAKGVLEIYFREKQLVNADQMEFLHIMAGQAIIAIDNAHLFENLQRSNQELSLAYDTTLEGWGKALELRDKETQGHTRRVTDLTLRLAREMGISETELVHIRRGVLLHDIGKMGTPDKILHKKGDLSEEEWEEMRKHPQYAYDLLAPIPYLRPALDIPYCHHEWWDGSGYPRGLKGEAIPLSARLFAVVDVWDALLSTRPYRKAWSRRRVIKYLKDQSGTHFDPRVVDIFLKMIEKETK